MTAHRNGDCVYSQDQTKRCSCSKQVAAETHFEKVSIFRQTDSIEYLVSVFESWSRYQLTNKKTTILEVMGWKTRPASLSLKGHWKLHPSAFIETLEENLKISFVHPGFLHRYATRVCLFACLPGPWTIQGPLISELPWCSSFSGFLSW